MHLSIWGKGHAMYVTKSFSICISYFIFHTMQHWKKRRWPYFVFVPFVIAYTISYVQISYVHLYAQLTIGRTYFSGILFFSSIKNVVSSISTGVPLKIFQHSLSYSTKPIFLRFIVFFTVHLLKVSNGETETELLWGSWVDQPVYFHVSCDVISCRFSITLFCFMPSSNF